jgi:DMSO/TMAO reductase YedYZ heme-binding membrane subunit
VAALGAAHFVSCVKADLRRPALFLVALGLLLVARLVPRAAARRVRAALGR